MNGSAAIERYRHLVYYTDHLSFPVTMGHDNVAIQDTLAIASLFDPIDWTIRFVTKYIAC